MTRYGDLVHPNREVLAQYLQKHTAHSQGKRQNVVKENGLPTSRPIAYD